MSLVLNNEGLGYGEETKSQIIWYYINNKERKSIIFDYFVFNKLDPNIKAESDRFEEYWTK